MSAWPYNANKGLKEWYVPSSRQMTNAAATHLRTVIKDINTVAVYVSGPRPEQGCHHSTCIQQQQHALLLR